MPCRYIAMSTRNSGALLCEVRWSSEPPDFVPFIGTLQQVVAFMNERHRQTGLQHAAREAGLPSSCAMVRSDLPKLPPQLIWPNVTHQQCERDKKHQHADHGPP